MVDPNTFLTTLYVRVATCCKIELPPEAHPSPAPSLTRSEVVTLALFGQWAQFQSKRAVSRYALRHLCPAFPSLPARPQCNRLQRHHQAPMSACDLHLVNLLQARHVTYEAWDCWGVPTRNATRRSPGWIPGLADIGWSTRLGWSEGFHSIMAVTPDGVITGFGFGAASTKDQPLADTFFAVSIHRMNRVSSAGHLACG